MLILCHQPAYGSDAGRILQEAAGPRRADPAAEQQLPELQQRLMQQGQMLQQALEQEPAQQLLRHRSAHRLCKHRIVDVLCRCTPDARRPICAASSDCSWLVDACECTAWHAGLWRRLASPSKWQL